MSANRTFLDLQKCWFRCLMQGTVEKPCSGLTLAGGQVPTKAALSLPSSAGQGERKYNERLMGQGKDRERSLTNYCHRQNRLNLEKLI